MPLYHPPFLFLSLISIHEATHEVFFNFNQKGREASKVWTKPRTISLSFSVGCTGITGIYRGYTKDTNREGGGRGGIRDEKKWQQEWMAQSGGKRWAEVAKRGGGGGVSNYARLLHLPPFTTVNEHHPFLSLRPSPARKRKTVIQFNEKRNSVGELATTLMLRSLPPSVRSTKATNKGALCKSSYLSVFLYIYISAPRYRILIDIVRLVNHF